MAVPPSYDERYLKGIRCFNERQFFECHEVLEDLWIETTSEDKKFYQGLIKAAVALYHFSRGNAVGARTLYYSSCDLLNAYRPRYKGVALDRFLDALEACFAEVLEDNDATLDERTIPVLTLESE